MDIKKMFQSKVFQIMAWSLAGLAILLLVFSAGMMVGFKKANFSFLWGENYHRNFGGPQGGFMGDFRGGDFMDAHGTVGQILKIDGNTLVIKGIDNVEKIVNVNAGSTMRRNREDVATSALKTGDIVIVIGQPNENGQIDAQFVRLMPPPGQMPVPAQPSSATSTQTK